jgi:hypothetical protein
MVLGTLLPGMTVVCWPAMGKPYDRDHALSKGLRPGQVYVVSAVHARLFQQPLVKLQGVESAGFSADIFEPIEFPHDNSHRRGTKTGAKCFEDMYEQIKGETVSNG